MGAGARAIDVNRYSTGNATLPGRYDVSIFINNQAAASLKIEFIETEKSRPLSPVSLPVRYCNCIFASRINRLRTQFCKTRQRSAGLPQPCDRYSAIQPDL